VAVEHHQNPLVSAGAHSYILNELYCEEFQIILEFEFFWIRQLVGMYGNAGVWIISPPLDKVTYSNLLVVIEDQINNILLIF